MIWRVLCLKRCTKADRHPDLAAQLFLNPGAHLTLPDYAFTNKEPPCVACKQASLCKDPWVCHLLFAFSLLGWVKGLTFNAAEQLVSILATVFIDGR